MEMSAKGFLAVRPFDQRLRMSKNQAESVKLAAHAALDHLLDQKGGPEVVRRSVELARCILVEALESYPVDASCVSCDYYADLEGDQWCTWWQDKIPEAHVEKGCPERKEEGAPF